MFNTILSGIFYVKSLFGLHEYLSNFTCTYVVYCSSLTRKRLTCSRAVKLICGSCIMLDKKLCNQLGTSYS